MFSVWWRVALGTSSFDGRRGDSRTIGASVLSRGRVAAHRRRGRISVSPAPRGIQYGEHSRNWTDWRAIIALQTICMKRSDALYSAWIAAGRLSPEDEQRLRSNTEQLKHLYEDHIQVEEKIVFPRAAEMLDSHAIAAMGQEFHARRR